MERSWRGFVYRLHSLAVYALLLALLLGCGGLHVKPSGGTDAAPDPLDDDMQRFQGTWYSLGVEVNGEQRAGENRENVHIFSGNKWKHTVKGRVIEEGTFTLVDRKPYRVIDSLYTYPKHQEGGHWLAIYRFNGDTVQWLGDNTDDLPTTVKEEDYERLPKSFETQHGWWMRTCKRLQK